MTLAEKQRELDLLLQQASELLGGPACPVSLESEMEAHVRRTARRDFVAGLEGATPIRSFLRGNPGSQMIFGLERFQLRIAGEVVPIVRVSNPFCDDCCDPLADLWAVPAASYRKVYRHLRRSTQDPRQNVPPVMDPKDRDRLWANTIGFLRRGEEALERFGVTLKRGVLLAGEPGNGKTMASRWLLAQAWRHNFEWRVVRPEEYESARTGGSAHYLFELDRPGIILFDDLDQALRQRDNSGSNLDASTFLSELDGLEVRRGVVYLFTSNAQLRELDPAFRRPGRIDQVIHFRRPSAEMRRRLVVEHWPAEIVEALPVDEVVERTEGFSFAEIDELKKLLVIEFLERGRWDWPLAWQAFRDRTGSEPPQHPLGFMCNGHHPLRG